MKSAGDKATLYPGSMAVLDALRDASVKMALASRTPTPDVADAFLTQLDLRQYFCDIQLIPASSGFDYSTAQKDTCHFPNIRRNSGIAYSDMLFFDDEAKNVQRVAKLGTTAIQVDTAVGMTVATLMRGLQLHARRRQAAGG